MNINIENIIKKFLTFTNTLSVTSDPQLISFSFSINDSLNQLSIDALNKLFSRVSIFYTPNDKQKLIGLNSAVDFSSITEINFSSVSKQIFKWKEKVANNWSETGVINPQIIFCSAKFDANDSSELWNDFESISFHVPQFVVMEYSGKTIAYFNFMKNKNDQIDSALNHLREYLKHIVDSNKGQLQTTYLIDSVLISSDKDELLNWRLIASKAIEKLKNKELNKLVLSRSYKSIINKSINWDLLLGNLYYRFPDCYLFQIKKGNSTFFGSSPEMFLKISNGIAEVESVAGSAARGEKLESDLELEKFLKSSEKNHKEHSYVSEYITDILVNYSNNLRVIEEKQIRKLDNIQHLLTKFSADLYSDKIIFELIDSLFPTPAVCGLPKNQSLEAIKNIEHHDRGLYSGLVGVFDFIGNCELAVSIRSAIVKDMQITAFAGAGLVENSDPEEEFQETKLKLYTILSLFTNEIKSKQK